MARRARAASSWSGGRWSWRARLTACVAFAWVRRTGCSRSSRTRRRRWAHAGGDRSAVLSAARATRCAKPLAARPRMRVCCAVSQDGKRRQAQVLRREGARSGGGDGAGGVARLAAATLVASPCGEVGQRQHPQHGWSSVPCGRETHRRERSRNQARPGWSRLIYATIGVAD